MLSFKPFAPLEKSKNKIEMEKNNSGMNVLTERYII